MKSSNEVMDSFMNTITNMKEYQGVDIMNPLTYGCNKELLEESFSLEKNIVSTQENEEKIKVLEMKN